MELHEFEIIIIIIIYCAYYNTIYINIKYIKYITNIF